MQKENNIDKLSQKNRDGQELENLRQGYQHCKEIYNIQRERFKSADEKLNMLLVFNGAILALLIIVLPIGDMSCVLKTLIYTFMTIFSINMLLTLIVIIVGMFPRKTSFISNDNYVDAKFYQCTNVEFYGKMIGCYTEYNNQISNKAENKHFFGKFAMICTILNIIFMFAMIIIKIL